MNSFKKGNTFVFPFFITFTFYISIYAFFVNYFFIAFICIFPRNNNRSPFQ